MRQSNFRINAYRDQSPKYAGCPWWFEVERTDPGHEVILRTGGMFDTEEEALSEGAAWVESDEGQESLRRIYRVPK